MATARKLASGQWRVQVYSHKTPEGKRIYESFTGATKKEAELIAAQFRMTKETTAKSSSLTFGQALDQYIDSKSKVLSPATIREYRRARGKCYADLEHIKVRDITRENVQRHVNTFALDHSPKSVRDNHALITAVLKVQRPSFALDTTLPQKERPDYYVPSDKDIKKLLAVVKDTPMELPILLAAFGPMRRGEICALKSDCIDGCRVHVCRNMVLNSQKEWVIKQPKSYAGDRYIDYPEFMRDMLAQVEDNATELNPNMITFRFAHRLKAAGIPHFRFHDLRHYCASILHALNIPDAYIMERGGWSSDQVLKSVYRHTMDDQATKYYKAVNHHFQKMQHEMQHKTAKTQ